MNISKIHYYLPEKCLENDALESSGSKFKEGDIYKKTGIKKRFISDENELVSDMAVKAAKKFTDTELEKVDFILLCTQTPDYEIPTTACIVQEKLNLPTCIGALDINLGCSGFVYAAAVAKGLLSAGISNRILLLMAEQYTKHIHPQDYGTRSLFGDAACAIMIDRHEVDFIGEFCFGTDGSGKDNLIIPASGAAGRLISDSHTIFHDKAGSRSKQNLYMNGLEIYNFTLDRIPDLTNDVLKKNHLCMDDIAMIIPHQANAYMLTQLRDYMDIPEEKFYIYLENIGNTVSCSIPIAMKTAWENHLIKSGDYIIILGFGVGYSWAGTILKIA